MNTISLSNLKKYLLDNQWIRLDAPAHFPVELWRNNEISNITLRVPCDIDLNDYQEAINRVLKDLSIVYHKDMQDIVNSINFQENIMIRVVADDVNNGTIPLSDGATLFQSAESLIKSAASKLFSNKNHGLSKREIIDEFMNTVRLGQTQVGSYIINIIPPENNLLHKSQFHLDTIQVEEINTVLYNALESLKKSISLYIENDRVEEFDLSRKYGADAAICHSLIQMSGAQKNRDIEIVLNTRYVNSVEKKSSIYFYSSEMESVQIAYDYFSGRDYLIKNGHYIGLIVQLKKEIETNFGKVTISTHYNGKPKKISLILNEEQYQSAIDAHKRQNYVQCIGDVHFTKTTAHMTDMKQFSVIETPELNLD